MPNDDKGLSLYERLSATHPLYDKMLPEWKRYKAVTDAIEFDKNAYFVKMTQEDPDHFAFRKAISEFVPECPLAIRGVETAVMAQAPRRDFGPHKSVLEDFVSNADSQGNHLNNVNLDVMAFLLTYGTTRGLMTNVLPEGVTDLSVDDEQKSLIRPRIVNYTPMEVPNWEMDRGGNLLWVLIKEEYTYQKAPLEKRVERAKFIYLDRQSYITWEFERNDQSQVRGTPQEWRLIGAPKEGEHGLGIVPMIVESLRGRGIEKMKGESFIKLSSRLDIRKFRHESDYNYDLYLHSHPTLVLKTIDDLAEVGVGTNAVLKLNPDAGEDAYYLEIPTAAFDALRAAIEEARHGIYRQAGTDPMGVLEPGAATFQASGIARAWSFSTTENRVLSSVGEVMERIEVAELDLALRYLGVQAPRGKDHVFSGSVSYPSRFDPASRGSLLDDCERVPAIINAPSFVRWMHKRYVQVAAEDVDQAEINEWEKEIDDNEILGMRQEPEIPDPSEMAGFFDTTNNQEENETGDDEESESADASPDKTDVGTASEGVGVDRSARGK